MRDFSDNQTSEKHLTDYLRVIQRRWRSVILLFLLIFFGTLGYTYRIKPIYEAQTTLRVTPNKPTLSVPWETNNPIEAEMEIVKSRSVAEQVVERLHLDWQLSDRSRGLSFKLLEFTVAPPRRTVIIEVTGSRSYRVTDTGGKLLATGVSGYPLQQPDITLLIADLKGKEGDKVTISQVPLLSAALRLKGRLSARQIGSERTNIMSLTYRDTDPVRARDILNTVAAVYMEKIISFKTEEATKTLDFLETQMNSIRGDLEGSEEKLEAYKTSAGIFSLDTEAAAVFARLALVDQQKAELGQQRKLLEFAVRSVKEARAKGHAYYPGDPVGMSMVSRMEELDSQKKALLSEFTEDHPQVRAVQSQIDEQLRQLLLIYQSALAGLAEKEKFLDQKLSEEEAGLKRLPTRERELIKLMRFEKVNSDIFTFLLQKYEEARLAKASTTGNVNIIDPAIAPQAPVKPDKQKNILFGFILGLFLGVGFGFFREYLDDTIKDSDAALREVGAPVLAVIPHIRRRDAVAGGAAVLVVYREPQSPSSEAFRGLRTSIHFSAVNKRKQLLLITSSFPGEGKSTLIANLAAVYEQTGARVLLIDCDLRRPSLHALFGMKQVPGVSDILAGDIGWRDAIRSIEGKQLAYLAAGTTPPNPAELLGSESMKSLIAELRAEYEYIFIDAPPVLAVTDAPVLTGLADLVLPVIETARVPAKAARRMGDILENAKAPVVGLVVNDKSGQSERYGYYGYYGYRYYGEDQSQMKLPWWRRFGARKRQKSVNGDRHGV